MKNKIIDFNLMRINKNAQKICRCNPPAYEIDTTNRGVQIIFVRVIKKVVTIVTHYKNIEKYRFKIVTN